MAQVCLRERGLVNKLGVSVQYVLLYLHSSIKEATADALHARGSGEGDMAAWSQAIIQTIYKAER